MVGVAALAAGCSPNAREHYLAAQRVSIRAESPTVTPPSDGELAAQDRTAREP